MKKVLIADDDPIVLERTGALLKSAGYRVVTHDGGRGLSTVIFKERPNVVLVDVMMPHLSGDQVVTLIRENNLFEDMNIVYVFFSVKSVEYMRPLVKKTGARGAIHKALSDEQFLKKFAELLQDP